MARSDLPAAPEAKLIGEATGLPHPQSSDTALTKTVTGKPRRPNGLAGAREARLGDLQEWLISGASLRTIHSFIQEQRNKFPDKWRCSDRQIGIDLETVRERIKTLVDKSRSYQFSLADRRLNDLYLAARAAGELGVARMVIKDLRELHGLDIQRKQKIEMGVGVNGSIEVGVTHKLPGLEKLSDTELADFERSLVKVVEGDFTIIDPPPDDA